MPVDIPGFSPYPDFLAFSITLLLTGMLAIGVKESTQFNSIFTCLNLLIVVYVIICGAFKADFHNWNLGKEDNLPVSAGTGGFMPFGFGGMMAGAATCFYGFVGFDIIATTGEEVKNPQKAIPISIVLSLLFISLAYCGVSAVQTLMWPYWDQNNDAPLPYVFEMVGWPVAKWIVSVGALAGLSTSLLGAMFPLPRVLYAMANDGVIFRNLGRVHPKYKTPLLATIISGVFAGGMAAIFNVAELADMMSIGTLMAYSLVAVSVLILRYYEDEEQLQLQQGEQFTETSLEPIVVPFGGRQMLRQLFNADQHKQPTALSSKLSVHLVISICAIIGVLDTLLIVLEDELFVGGPMAIAVVVFVALVLATAVVALGRQPRSLAKLSFQVPWVPVVPVLSVTINVYLMFKLSMSTWIRFAVWMIIGLSIYIGYGFRESTGAMNEKDKKEFMIRRHGYNYEGNTMDEESLPENEPKGDFN